VPIYSCLEKRSLGAFVKSVSLALLICAATYSVAGILGYLTFGSNVPSDILEAYDAKDPVVFVGLVSLALKMYTTYPILLFCGR
jgi:sodium-coupled neutral amino acid transporter 7/8